MSSTADSTDGAGADGLPPVHVWVLTASVSLLAACAGGNDQDGNTAVSSEEKVVHVYNWADYVAESTIRDFEARTGIRVVYDVYDSSEVLATKLLTGNSGYDVVFPTGSYFPKLIEAGTLRKLDRSKLSNFANLDADVLHIAAVYDPGNEHGLPYLRGTTGIGYNPDMVEKVLGTRTLGSLAAVFDPAIASRLAKCGITMLDAPETMFALALIYLGLSANSEDPAQLAAAEAVLSKARPYVRYFHSSQYVNDLASGEVCVSVGWSGGVMQARTRGAQASAPVEIVYAIPSEGAPLWIDQMAIPTDAPHPENAHAFLNFLLEPRVMAAISNTVGQASGNAAAWPFVAETLRTDPAVYPTDAVWNRLQLEQNLSPATVRTVTRAWTRIRAGQ